LQVTGRFHDAELLLTDSVKQLQSGNAPPTDLARMLGHLAGAYQAEGDLARAESTALQAQELCAGRGEVPARDRVNLQVLLAGIFVDQRRYEEAESLLRETLPAVNDQQAVGAYNSLAAISLARNGFAEAEEFSRIALDRARSGLPREHPSTAMVLNNLAQACRFQGKHLQAESYYRRAIETWESVLGPSHPDVAKGLMNLAGFYHDRGREAGAEDLYVRSAAILERTLGSNAPLLLIVRNELADVLRAERRYSESEKLGRASLSGMERSFQAGDPRLLRALGNRAKLLAETSRPAEAAALATRVREVAYQRD
jgi:tetratricopeptide (TPR) repeat protein